MPYTAVEMGGWGREEGLVGGGGVEGGGWGREEGVSEWRRG